MDPETQSTIPPDAKSGSPVAWQTIYFLLVALGTSTATQPCGRVCGLPSRYAMYLRVSPIVCAVDAALAVLFLMFGYVVDREPMSGLIRQLLNLRFDEDRDDEVGDVTEHLRINKKAAVFRWMFFLFGGLLPSIKLAALIGIPMSKAWGVMYLASFMVIEGLVVLRKKHGLQGPMHREEINDMSNSLFNLFSRMITSVVIGGQVILFYWANVGLLDRILYGFNDSQSYYYSDSLHWSREPRRHIGENMVFSFIIPIALSCLPLSSIALYYSDWTKHISKRSVHMRIGFAFCCGICLGFISYSEYLFLQELTSSYNTWDSLIMIPFWSIISAMVAAVWFASFRWPKTLDYVLPEREITNLREVEDRERMAGVLAFVFFTLHIFVPPLWYAFVYNPRWTYQSSWTSVFG